jgi:hypothetical protein
VEPSAAGTYCDIARPSLWVDTPALYSLSANNSERAFYCELTFSARPISLAGLS